MSTHDEPTLADELIYDGKLVKLHRLTVQLPNGARAQREIVRHPGAVAMVALLGEDVLLVRQFRAAAGKALLEIPAGTLEAGEAPEAAAVRELQEEVGYRPGKLERLGGEFTAPGYTSEYIHLYLASALEPARLQQDSDEFIEVVRLPFAEALALAERGEIEDGKTLIGLLLSARRLGR